MSTKRDHFANLLVFVAVLSAFVTSGLVLYRHIAERAAPQVAPVDGRVWARVQHWEELASNGIDVGSNPAPVTIVEFTDFQCPFCKQLSGAVDTVLARHPGQVHLVSHQFPLSQIHPLAYRAALAAKCANEQGAYYEFRKRLFSRQDSIAGVFWAQLAQASGATDTLRFQQCLSSRKYAQAIDHDLALGDSLGLIGTPAIIVNGYFMQGAVSARTLDSVIRQVGN